MTTQRTQLVALSCMCIHKHRAVCLCVYVLSCQEPDAGRTQADNKDDPDFGVSKEEMAAADQAAAEDVGAGEAGTVLLLPGSGR